MNAQVTVALYNLVSQLPRYNFDSMQDHLPPDGIYFFFERGETVDVDCSLRDRITHVGTHRESGRLSKRIQQHYGYRTSLRGSKNASALRRHIGGAILRRDAPGDPRFERWIKHGTPTLMDVEEHVSQELRSNFTFVYIPIESYSDRKPLVQGSIAALAQLPIRPPSDAWLGRSAAAEQIRESGLWNVEHVNSEPLGSEDIRRLELFAGLRR